MEAPPSVEGVPQLRVTCEDPTTDVTEFGALGTVIGAGSNEAL